MDEMKDKPRELRPTRNGKDKQTAVYGLQKATHLKQTNLVQYVEAKIAKCSDKAHSEDRYFWDMTPHQTVRSYRRFGGVCCLAVQKNIQSPNTQARSSKSR
jgi:hypothetical protein